MSEPGLEVEARKAWESFTIPRARPISAEERRVLGQADRFSFEYDGERMDGSGGELAGFAWGEGPTVFLAHGWGGRGVQLGFFVEPLVARGFRVITIDVPAHGESVGQRTNIFEFVRTLRGAQERLGPFHALIGHSLGAAAAVICAEHGVDLGRLVLIAATARLRDEVLKFTRRVELESEVASAMLLHMQRIFGDSIWDDTTLVQLSRRFETDRVPALIVHDEHDGEVEFADSVELARVWGGSELFSTSGLGHVALLRSTMVADEVVSYLGR